MKTSLKGEAELLIRDLSTMSENYDRAWKTLSSYYENKRLLVRAYLANFVSLSKMKSESAVELQKIFHSMKSTVNSLENIGRPISSGEDLFVYLAVELLDPRSRREWESFIRDRVLSDPPSYADLEHFFDRHLHTLESMTPVKTDGTGMKTNAGNAKSVCSHLARKQESKSEGKTRCALCPKDHFILYCDEYKKKSAVARKQCLEEKTLCLNYLGRHRVSKCASKKDCSACGSRLPSMTRFARSKT